jgi:hypothetical protein
VISEQLAPGNSVLLIAPVRGLASEAEATVAQVAEFRPDAVGFGLSSEELQGLLDYFVAADAEPVVPLSSAETSEVRGLVRFGEVRVPNPSFVEALRWATASGVPVDALDPNDERSASLFAEHIGYLELVRRTVRERRMSRHPPTPSSPDEFALSWEREVASGRGSRDFAGARDRHLARAVERLRRDRARIAIVVDRERFEPVRELLTNGVGLELRDR